MADTTPQLKRKRESTIGGSNRKSKKQREAERVAGAGEEAAAAPVAEPAQDAQTTQTPTDKSKSKSRKTQANGVPVEAPTTTSKPKSTPQPKSLPDGESDAPNVRDIPSNTLDEKTPKKERITGLDKRVKNNTEEARALKAARKKKAEDDKARKDAKKEELRLEVVAKAEEKKIKQEKHAQREGKKEGRTAEKALTKSKNKSRGPWNASPAQGGWFLPQDPIFSSDEKHIIVATPKAVQIYTAETSLLARALPITSPSTIVTAFALSATKPNQLYVADSTHLVTLWNWVEGTKLGRWQIGAMVRQMVVVAQPGSDEDLVYCHESSGKSQVINVHALRTKEQASQTELKQVLKQTDRLQRLQVLLQGKYVIITSHRSITIGKRLRASKTAVKDFDYVWRELQFSNAITTCDVYHRRPILADNGKKSAEPEKDILDLAVGDEIGVILFFEDILASFAASERSQKNQTKVDSAEEFRPKRLHWHRNAVGSVRWSLDGNYLISGGDETVLTLWQLATGKPQHLPHLTAAIENVVVSPSGSAYALSLANNSVIVLSTTELDAKTNIVGIQSRWMDTKHLTTFKDGLLAMQTVPIAVDPKNTQQILCAVPASQPRQRSGGIQPSPYLQTFDVANQRPISRQALTRNNATDPNQGPDGKRILEPDVHLLQISHDGQYLATVDEWLPPQVDLNYIDEGVSHALEEERLRRREVHFKIWVWDEKKAQWSLETRIDAPHFLEDASSNGRVLDLVVNPKQLGFATIGEDHVVRIWKPKTRSIQGIVRRGANEGGTVNWTIHGSITLPNPNKLWLSDAGAGPSRTRTLRLAYSADGSILAAGVSGASDADRGLVYLIDTNSGTIRRSMTEIDTTVLCGLGIVGRCLVAITDCITVWDMVSDNLVYCTSIKTAGFDSVERTSVVRLAVNEADGTFAVSLPQLEGCNESTSDVKRASSKLAIYGTEHGDSTWSTTVPGITLGLAARKGNGARGYIALDSISCIRTIDPVAGTLGLPALQPVKQEVQMVVQDEVVEEESGDTTDRRLELEDAMLENEYDKPVVTQQDLELIFHNESAPQAPKDVFSAVLRLFGGVGKAAA